MYKTYAIRILTTDALTFHRSSLKSILLCNNNISIFVHHIIYEYVVGLLDAEKSHMPTKRSLFLWENTDITYFILIIELYNYKKITIQILRGWKIISFYAYYC